MAQAKRSKAEETARRTEVLRRLSAIYPNAHCALEHKNPFELLVATVLSAQCTDARVNIVTRELFKEAPTAAALNALPEERVRTLIRSINFFNNKTKSLKGLARLLMERWGGEVPKDMDALLALPGVARKTANVVLGNAFDIASGIVVDTHVGRLSRRLGFTKSEDPAKVEADLVAWVPKDRWVSLSHELIDHGRAVCSALRPKCAECTFADICPGAAAASAPLKKTGKSPSKSRSGLGKKR